MTLNLTEKLRNALLNMQVKNSPAIKWYKYRQAKQVFRKKLLELIKCTAGDRLLDLACGTGTLTRMIKNRKVLDGFEVTRDNALGRLPGFISDAGFRHVTVVDRVSTMLGTLDLITAIPA